MQGPIDPAKLQADYEGDGSPTDSDAVGKSLIKKAGATKSEVDAPFKGAGVEAQAPEETPMTIPIPEGGDIQKGRGGETSQKVEKNQTQRRTEKNPTRRRTQIERRTQGGSQKAVLVADNNPRRCYWWWCYRWWCYRWWCYRWNRYRRTKVEKMFWIPNGQQTRPNIKKDPK